MKYPVLATRGIVVFPKHSTIIEVGRKSSLNAIEFSIVSHQNKMIVTSQRNVLDDDIKTEEQLYDIGTLVNFKVTKEYPNGQKQITVIGEERVKLSNFNFNNGQLIETDATILKNMYASDEEEKAFVNQVSHQLDDILSKMAQIPNNVLSNLASGISAEELSDVIAHYLPLTLVKKQKLLEELNVNKRLELINEYIIKETKVSEIERDIENSVKSKLDTQQKEFLLRERMKAIKEELGDISSKESDVDKWKEKIKDKKYPQHVKDAVLVEIRKYEGMPPMSAETHVIHSYIEWILKLPWKTFSDDNENIDKAKEVLSKHHYGLKKVKERIIEHLAVKIQTRSNAAPILTLVGPPGVGKTSLGRSIAEAVDREFVKISLGGVKDESEIRGHRRTYVGAMPGKVIQAFNKAKTSNPVILLDEIDKMSADYKGDPTSAMLEVLDPEQNKYFQDHYLELEYDLSKVMFIGTANYYEQIPRPLLDRVELIFLDQYTSEEKLQIAKEYIIPKVLKENGLKSSQFKISDSTIAYVIDKYTLEAGVRDLKRKLSKLARKVVLKVIEGEVKGAFSITLSIAKEMLGKEQVYKEDLDGKGEIGLVNGMYYSSVGGGILPLEVTTYPSKNGGVKLTGSVKEVMQESLQIAVAYIRANAKEFGVDFNFEENIIQVHAPAGATPKDGPSAGTAFTTAILSALKKTPIKREIAFTGEITLRGKVLPIGGLKEKSIGSVEVGVRKIYIPFENTKDIDDLAKKVKEKAEIIPIKDYKEIYKDLFK